MDESSSEISLHESSSFKKHGSSEDLVRAKEDLSEMRERDLSKYGLIEIDSNKETEYGQIVKSVKDDLIRIHRNAGIKIEHDDFPKVSLVQQDRLSVVSFKSDEDASDTLGGGYHVGFDRVRVFVRGEGDLLLDIRCIYHEFFHSLGGAKVVITKLSGAEGMVIGGGKVGYRTDVFNKNESERGGILEDGVVDNWARNFSLYSDLPIVVEARKKYAKKKWERFSKKLRQQLEIKKSDIDKLCYFGLIFDTEEKYNNANKLITYIVRKAGEKKGGALKMSNLLIQAREKPGKRRLLIEKIDELFGKGMGKKLFKAQFKGKDVSNLTEEFENAMNF